MLKSLFRRTPQLTPFAQALAAYGFDGCAYNAPRFYVGLTPGLDQSQAIDHLPQDIARVYFLDAPGQIEVIQAFLSSPEIGQTTRLMIGSSLDVLTRGTYSLDFSQAVAALAGGRFPAVTSLSLGDMWRTFNGHPYTGTLGDIAPVFDAFPNLQEVELFGNFTLSRPVRHTNLRSLAHTTDVIGVNGGAISNDTLRTLLTSDLPALRTLDMDLDDGDTPVAYSLPAGFPDRMPKLRTLVIEGLAPVAAAQLNQLRNALPS